MKIPPAPLSLWLSLKQKRTAELLLVAAALLMVSVAPGQVGSLDTRFDPGSGANGKVNVVAIQKDGRILIGGEFTSVNGVGRPYLARLNSDGSVDETFGPVSTFAPITSLAIQEDGKILVNNAQPLVRIGGLLRLNADGSLDTTFGNQGGIANVWAFALQCDGKIVVGDNGLRRLNADGSLDLDFTASHGIFYFFGLFSQPDGKVIASGLTSAGDFPGFTLAASYRFNPDGSADDTFYRGALATSFGTQPDGKIVFGGLLFYSFGRLNLDGSLDTNFAAGLVFIALTSGVASGAVQADGKIVVGGSFLRLGQFPRQHIGRLFSDGTVDSSFAANTSINGDVLSVAIDNSGRVVIGGQFSTVDGESRNRIARLLANDSTSFDPCRTPQPTDQSPTIVSEPTRAEVTELSTVSFDVGVRGTEPFSYQWYFNGQTIAGANQSIITIPQVHFGDVGRYSVIVSNSFGSVASDEATLAVGYRLEVGTLGNGSVQIDPLRRVYLPGVPVELTATGIEGRQFREWLGDVSGTANPQTVVMDGHKKITAQFEYFPGDLKWQVTLPNYSGSSPALGDDGTVYFASDKVYAFDGQTGTKRWEFLLGDFSVSAPALGEDGTVYVGSLDNKVYALNGATGAKKWEFLTRDKVNSSAAIGADGTVYIGSNDGKLYALDGETGEKRWDFLTGAFVRSSPAVGADGTVYFGSSDTKVYALDGATGAKKWEFQAGLNVRSSPALGADGTVYFGADDGKVYAVDGATGIKKWEFVASGWILSSPAVGPDGTVYIGADKFYALDGGTGAKKWDFPVSIPCSSPTIAADGTVYISYYALDAATGAKKWEGAFGGCISVALGPDGSVYAEGTAVQGASGLADSPWPRFRGNNRNTARVSAGPSPVILSSPPNKVVAEFSQVELGVVAGGSQPLSYQWYFNGQSISGGVDSVFTIPRVQFTNAGTYSVVVSNAFGSVTSPQAVLTVGYSLEVFTRGLGTVQRDEDRTVYPPNSIIELTAAGEGKRRFIGWFGDASGNTNSIVILMDANKRITAQFETANGELLWAFQTFAQILSCPAMGDDGAIYFGSNDGNVYAVEGFSGRKLWQFATRGPVTASPALGVNGMLYVGSHDKKIYGLDAATGAKRWEFATDGEVYSSPAVGIDDTIYVGSDDQKVYALDGSTGATKWEFQTAGMVRGSPTVGAGGAVYVGSGDGKVYCLDGATGLKKWEFARGFSDNPFPVMSEDGTIWLLVGKYALDAATGSIKWSYQSGLGDSSPVVGQDGAVFEGSSNGLVLALDGITGANKWTLPSGGAIFSSLVLGADGTIFFGNDKIVAVDSMNGDVKWKLQAVTDTIGNSHYYSSPALGLNGELYIGGQDGRLLAIQAGTGLATAPWPKFRGDSRNTGGVHLKLSVPQLQSPMMSGQTFQFSMPTQLGGTYRVEFKNLLSEPAWTPLADVIRGDGTAKLVTAPAADGSQRFYRVRVE